MNNKNVENPAERSFLSESITPIIECMNVRVTMDMISRQRVQQILPYLLCCLQPRNFDRYGFFSIILLVLVLPILQMGISPSMNLVSILLELYKLCLEKHLK